MTFRQSTVNVFVTGLSLLTPLTVHAEKGIKNMVPQESAFPRDIYMTIRELPPMRCVSFWDTGSTPEETVGKLMDKFIEENQIPNDPTRFMRFGRNNPMKGKPHGYESFLRIPDDPIPKTKATVKNFPGGLYAVVRIKGMDYGQAKPMVQWILKSSTYGLNYPDKFDMEKDPCPELEEIISERDATPEKTVMDYYIPIRRKKEGPS